MRVVLKNLFISKKCQIKKVVFLDDKPYTNYMTWWLNGVGSQLLVGIMKLLVLDGQNYPQIQIEYHSHIDYICSDLFGEFLRIVRTIFFGKFIFIRLYIACDYSIND